MKQPCLVGLFLLCTVAAFAQDEGAITQISRIGKDAGIFIGFGPSFTLGKNIGDYSTGFNFEVGFLKRTNRVLSIGPSLSVIRFKYDPSVTSDVNGDAYLGYGDPNDWSTTYDSPGLKYDYGYIVNLSGGDVTLASLAVNLKLNLVPIKDNTVVSVYGFVKPFISYASRSEVSGTGERYVYGYYEEGNTLYYEYQGYEEWHADGYTEEWGADSYPALESKSQITGGVFLGPGVEFIPAKRVSIFVQAAFGYTFPINFVSTKAYGNTVDSYTDEEFPMVKEGFPSVNVQAGISFNF